MNKSNPSTLHLDSEAELREKLDMIIRDVEDCYETGRGSVTYQLLDLIYEREKQARKEVKEECND